MPGSPGPGTRRAASLRAMSNRPLRPVSAASTPHAVRVRRATSSDLDSLVALENRVFSADRLRRRQWRRHLESSTALVLVAVSSGAIVAAVVVFWRRGSDIARLYSMARLPEARGRGLGDVMLVACESAARRRGSRRMRLEVRRDNAGAQRLYVRHGYVRIGQREAYYEDAEDALLFEKALAAK